MLNSGFIKSVLDTNLFFIRYDNHTYYPQHLNSLQLQRQSLMGVANLRKFTDNARLTPNLKQTTISFYIQEFL
jgi:hypothetical protein